MTMYVKLQGKFTHFELTHLEGPWYQITHLVGDMIMAMEHEVRDAPLYDHHHHPLVSRSGNIIVLYNSVERRAYRYNVNTHAKKPIRYLTILGHVISLSTEDVAVPFVVDLTNRVLIPEAYTPVSDEPQKE